MDVREKLVEWIFGSLCRHIHKSCKLAENIADDLIAHGVTAHEWISVEVELPERGQLVLVFDTICYVAYADRKGLWHYYSPAGSYCSSTKNPSHWMPLPEPPKMDGGAE